MLLGVPVSMAIYAIHRALKPANPTYAQFYNPKKK
jgi:hypothetical protein